MAQQTTQMTQLLVEVKEQDMPKFAALMAEAGYAYQPYEPKTAPEVLQPADATTRVASALPPQAVVARVSKARAPKLGASKGGSAANADTQAVANDILEALQEVRNHKKGGTQLGTWEQLREELRALHKETWGG